MLLVNSKHGNLLLSYKWYFLNNAQGNQGYPLSDLYGQRGGNSKLFVVSLLTIRFVWLLGSYGYKSICMLMGH